ncbi:MAG: hypothetical protein JJT96_16225 [Opitutales bacterium]|nr:hypothetical protein [Opitutales bacterium]
MPIDYQPIEIDRNGVQHRLLVAGVGGLPPSMPWRVFLSSRKVAGAAFLEIIEWAESFPTGEAILATGHHSPVEKEVTRILLRRGGRVVVLPARGPFKQVPAELRVGFKSGRVHLLAIAAWKDSRPTRARCLERNALLRELCDESNKLF